MKNKPVLELKGSLLTLMVLNLFNSDNEVIAKALAEKISKAPDFFQQVPIVIDLQALEDNPIILDLSELIKLLRTYGLTPVAVRGGSIEQNEIALNMNLGILNNIKSQTSASQLTEETKIAVTPEILPTKIIRNPIRSGQQVIADKGDLIVLSTVSHGAEILADRHIHVYGALRGRALAGINGDKKAQIFCQQLYADLLSIAGQYQVNEDFPNDLIGKSAQVYLEQDNLIIKEL
ncbi:septum site-determining protein MinC [Candidatus Marithrix sp. Canyon 246]|uniref:septum site-determining protein MinC n=1 Tax=Candidatus Marithrix sp. Canyon 246 TaxID=1827136 RepID=UPI00084A2479|nr:septum site-determining protein MinC [Candidatus Marithrix sp. Canyon 246]